MSLSIVIVDETRETFPVTVAVAFFGGGFGDCQVDVRRRVFFAAVTVSSGTVFLF
jgi:hypothetical protein